MKDQFEQWSQATSKWTLQPLVKLNGIHSKMVERVARQQIDQASDMLQQGMKQLQCLSQAKKIDDVWSAQSQLCSTLAAESLKSARENLDSSLEYMNEVSRWFEKNLAHMGCCASDEVCETSSKKK